MSSLALSQSSVQPVLTSYANGVMGDDLQKLAGLAEILAPNVGVLGRMFRNYKHDVKVQEQILETKRALGGAAKRVGFGIETELRTLETHGLDVVIDDQERRNAEGAPILMLEQRKIQALITTATRSHLKRVVDAVNTGLTAATAGSAGVWTTNTNDPIDEIDAEMEVISNACGSMPNFVVMGIGAWTKFRKNTLVKSRFSGVKVQSLKLEDTLGMFLNPNAKVILAEAMYDAAALGLSASLTRMIGNACWLLYNNPQPNEQDQSFAKTFFNLNTGLLQVGQPYRDGQSRADVYPVDWDSSVQVTNSVAGKKFAVT